MACFHRLIHANALRAIALAGVGSLAATSAQAATYTYFYSAGPGTYSAAAKSTVAIAVPIYLNEFSTNAFDLSLINDEAGLTSASFSVTKSGGATIKSVTGNPGTPALGGFDGAITVVGATVSESTFDIFTGALASPVAAGNYYRVRLGTLNVFAAASPGSTTFTIAPLAGDGTTTNLDSYDLDNSAGNTTLYESATSTNFTFTTSAAVPEPASAAVAVAAIAALARRRRA